jgi:hypothetical protein
MDHNSSCSSVCTRKYQTKRIDYHKPIFVRLSYFLIQIVINTNFIFSKLISSLRARRISETIEFPKIFTIKGNIALALWITLDTVGFLIWNLAAGIVFLLVALIAIYGILKFLGCMRPCYNCKKCTFGLGRLAALYFGKRSLKDFTETYGLTVALFFYVFIGPFPAVFTLFSVIQTFTIVKMLVFVFLLIFSVFSALTWRNSTK